jgi:hypothetical protein
MLVTLAVFQAEMFWLKVDADWRLQDITPTLATFHEPIF